MSAAVNASGAGAPGPLAQAFGALQDRGRQHANSGAGAGGFSSVLGKLAAAQAEQHAKRSALRASQQKPQPVKLQFASPSTSTGASSPPSAQPLVRGVRQLLDLSAPAASLSGIDYNALYRQCELISSYSLRTSDDGPLQSLYEAVKVEVEKSLSSMNRQLRAGLPQGSSGASGEEPQQEQVWLASFANSWTLWKERTHLVASVLLPLDRAAHRNGVRVPAEHDSETGRLSIPKLAVETFAMQVMQNESLRPALLPFITRAVDSFCRLPLVETAQLAAASDGAGKQPLPPLSPEALAFQKLYVASILTLFRETESYDELARGLHAGIESYYGRLAPAKLAASREQGGQGKYASLYAQWMASVVEHEKELSIWLYDNELAAGKAMNHLYSQVATPHAEELSKGLESVLEEVDIPTLGHLYTIFQVASPKTKGKASTGKNLPPTPLARLRTAVGDYIRTKVEAIVKDNNKDDEMIERLLSLKSNLDKMVSSAFGADGDFAATMRDSFAHGINKRDNKPPELIAKHVDLLLRSGNKTMSDAELEAALNNALVLFRFTKDKDMFEEFYTRYFAKRLLLNKSASSDAEMSMLLKLKEECGPDFTRKLETMLKDIALSEDIMKAWESFESKARGTGELTYQFDMSVNVLTQAHWPTYPQHELTLPHDMARATETFNTFYQGRNSGRKLHWQHSLGSNTIIAEFPKAGQKELLVSTYQAVILMLFNHIESGAQLSYKDIAAQTRLEPTELKRNLQSLACGPIPTRVLRKHPQGRDVNDDDAFSVNDNLKNERLRIRINQIQMAQTQEEQKDTEQRVLIDRELVLQAAAVRVLKAKKEIKHSDLMTEVVEQIKGRFGVDASELKKAFESLLEKDYMERIEGQRGMYRYVA